MSRPQRNCCCLSRLGQSHWLINVGSPAAAAAAALLPLFLTFFFFNLKNKFVTLELLLHIVEIQIRGSTLLSHSSTLRHQVCVLDCFPSCFVYKFWPLLFFFFPFLSLGFPLDMLRCESLLGLDQATCSRVLNKNYKLLVSMAPLSNEIRPISSCTPQVPRCCQGRRTGGEGCTWRALMPHQSLPIL